MFYRNEKYLVNFTRLKKYICISLQYRYVNICIIDKTKMAFKEVCCEHKKSYSLYKIQIKLNNQ